MNMIPGEAIEHIEAHVDTVMSTILQELKEIRKDIREIKADLEKTPVKRAARGKK